MKTPIIVAVLLVLAVPANAEMRHDRICDLAQDSDKVTLNRPGWNAIRFGKCTKIVADEPVKNREISIADHWHVLSCGYQAYREGKKLEDNPYQNEERAHAWELGWEDARQSCETNQLPFGVPIVGWGNE